MKANKKIINIFLIAALMAMSCLYGILIQRDHIFPYQEAKSVYRSYVPLPTVEPNRVKPTRIPTTPIATPDQFTTLDPEYLKTDVESLITIRTEEDAVQLRKKLNEFIFGEPAPSRIVSPAQVIKNYQDERYTRFYEEGILERIDYVVVKMDYEMESRIYHFIPKNPNRSLVIFHQGHDGELDFTENIELIHRLVENGYAVAGFCLPLYGLNNQPTPYIEGVGYFHLTYHDHMKLLSPEKGHPVQYFLTPLVAFVNYAEKEYAYEHIGMSGISGGGWTTTFMAATDTRIEMSFPVAGSLPIFLRSNARSDWGDWEQSIPELNKTANYLDLYILGAYGEGRYQLQILNQFDALCFWGVRASTYSDIVSQRVDALVKGNWDFLLDEKNQAHSISSETQEKIINILNENWLK
jgi:hypothetical protein